MHPVRLAVVTGLVAALGWSVPAWGASPTPPRSVAAVANPTGPTKGPVGWDVYRRLDRMAEIPVGTETRSFSSFDRTGGNADFIPAGAKCLSTSGTGCLIASHDGPGEIDSIWFTSDGPAGLGDVSQAGNLVVQLDGQTPVNYPLEPLVEGRFGAPFVYPLVADRFQSSGGAYIKVPMSFRQSMRVYTSNTPKYYNLDYRVFADAAVVSTFTTNDQASDVISTLKNAGRGDPKPPAPGAVKTSLPLAIAPGQSATLATEAGPGSISELHLSLPALLPGAPAGPQVAAPATAGHEVSGAVEVPLDPSNQGARLVYQGPPGTAPQSSPVLVDGQPTGTFSGPVGGGGVAQTLDLPATATAGKSRATLKDVLLVPGSTITAVSLRGGQPVRSDVVHPALLSGQPATASTVSPQITDLLNGLRVRLTFDGQQTVDLSLGEFFASPLDGSPVASLLTAVQSQNLWSWYLMPYMTGATVELYNGSSSLVTGMSDVTAAPSQAWTTALAPDGSSGYFRASSHQADSSAGTDLPLLDQSGGGKLVGLSVAMRGGSQGRLFLEGDERFALDGSRTPQEQGTGTEDFFEAGWYFSNGTFTDPFNGMVTQQAGTTGCGNQCLTAYRLFVADSVPFHAGAHLGIEHGSRNDSAANYDATAYLYAQPTPSVRVTGAVDVGLTASEQAASFMVAGNPPPKPLTATFEGPFDTVPVGAFERAGGGATTFTLPADPAAASVTIRRTSDQATGGQSADVFVNDKPAGRWSEPLGNASSRWLEDDYRLPPALTSGASTLSIRIIPVAGSPPWTAARYAILNEGAAAQDTSAPAFSGPVSSSSPGSRPVALSWAPATDDSPSVHYLVYRSPTPGNVTPIGETRMTGFVDASPPPTSTARYSVVPVDESGNIGPPSSEVDRTMSARLVLEGETTPVTSNALASPQSMTQFGSGWSGGAQEFLQAYFGTGAELTFSINVSTAMTYGLSVALTRARDYGIATVSIDGHRFSTAFDGYAPTLSPSGPLAFGFASLASGPHTVRMTIVGRNPASTGYYAGVDYLQLDAVGQGDPIRLKASALAAAGVDLGSPVGGEQAVGPGISQTYQRGRILWSPDTGAHEVHGAILTHYLALGGPGGFLGYPTTDEKTTPDGIGRYNHFSKSGSIYWTPSTGAWSIHGAIRAKWASLGWELSFLGYPTTDETTTPDGIGRFNHFSNSGSIYWTPSTGAWSVHGAIRTRWASMGWERSCLGYPVSDEFGIAGGRQSNFQRGFISFSFATGAATASC